MATQDADDQEVFEIVDYTTASEWECFITAVEETIHDWRIAGERHRAPLTKGQLATAKWKEKSSVIKFADFPFSISYHSIVNESAESPQDETEPSTDYDDEDDESMPPALNDLMNRENDFPARAHCLTRWYGLGEFMVLAPANVSKPIMGPSKSHLLLSSLTVAVSNTNCQVPMFVNVMQASDKMYLGVGIGHGIRTDYDMVHLKTPPQQCSHLAGLLDMFRSKLGSTITPPSIMVSVRLTYVLKEWPHTHWTQQPPDFDAVLDEVGFSDLGIMPFGALSDPVSELQVSATWPCVSEDLLVDSEVYSDLDPGSAPLWTARVVPASSSLCLLSEYLKEFLSVCRNTESLDEILGSEIPEEEEEPTDYSSALNRLTEDRVPTISNVVRHVKRGRKGKQSSNEPDENCPIPKGILIPILNYLFPDAEAEPPHDPYPATFSQVPEWTVEDGETQDHPLKSFLSNLKSSGVECFVWRLGLTLCHVISAMDAIPAAAYLWREVILELRFRWENSHTIPGVAPGSPDLASTLLHQKLQLLNCCIARKKSREQSSSRTGNGEQDEDDEFFECEEELDSETSESRSSWDKPEGRLKRCGQLRLLKTKEPLYIPITQEPAPMTEDQLEEHQNVLVSLGTDSVGSSLRARLMSPTLLSDMESFKAANPSATIEDFVRWYSPRDWIEEPSEDDKNHSSHGSLSTRMKLPGNMWEEIWNNAKPVPARRQKRLFDETRAAEKTLHWFNSQGPGSLCCHLLPTIMHASLCRFAQEKLLFSLPSSHVFPQFSHSNTLATVLEILAQRILRLSRQPPKTSKYEEVINQLAEIEKCIAQAQSVRIKILGESSSESSGSNTLEELALRLYDSPEVILEGGPRGPPALAIRKLFQQAHKASQLLDDSPQETSRDIGSMSGSNYGPVGELGRPAGREYLLRTMAPTPSPDSRPVPHRMYAVLLPNEFRLSGAFSQDTVFC